MRLRAVLACALLAPSLLALPAAASGCTLARSVWGSNPSYGAVSAAIDAAATRRKVPPPLLRAIAWRESGWQQFRSDGRAKVSFDCGIGIMQITGGNWDYRRLASDYRYNIDAGALVLAAKMSASSRNVPTSLGPDERRVLENWYRATYRYNGAGWSAERYADSVFALVKYPPAGIRTWAPAVAVTNPKTIFPNYHPTGRHSYVARIDGLWVSTLGRYRRSINRADYLAHRSSARPGTVLEADQRATSAFVVRNLGWETWSPTRVTLGTYPVGRRSRLAHPAWLTPTRPAALRSAVPPGGTARFDFPVQAAAVTAATTTTEHFAPLVDGRFAIQGSRAASRWTLHPAQAPTASVVTAPEYVTDAATDDSAPLRLDFADPAPGSGFAYVEVQAREACVDCPWVAAARSALSFVRVPLATAGRHEVRVRAVDRAGHRGAWTAPVAVVVPRDDTAPELVFTGEWTTESVSDSWWGSVAAAPTGAAVETSFSGSAYAVIGTRAPDAAPLAVYLDGELVAVVDPVAEATEHRQVLVEGTIPMGDHVLRIVVGGTEAQPVSDPGLRGYVDAIAVT